MIMESLYYLNVKQKMTYLKIQQHVAGTEDQIRCECCIEENERDIEGKRCNDYA